MKPLVLAAATFVAFIAVAMGDPAPNPQTPTEQAYQMLLQQAHTNEVQLAAQAYALKAALDAKSAELEKLQGDKAPPPK